MNLTSVPLLIGLVALLAGLAVGKAWERYKLRDGRWIDRRRARQSPHYMVGLNFLVVEPCGPRDRGAVQGVARPTRMRWRFTSFSATCIARRARSDAPSPSTRRCCSGRD